MSMIRVGFLAAIVAVARLTAQNYDHADSVIIWSILVAICLGLLFVEDLNT